MTITPEQFSKLATKNDVEEIVEEKMTKFKDEILTGQDKLMKKFGHDFDGTSCLYWRAEATGR